MTQESYYHPVKTARIGGESGGQLSGGGITPFCGGCRVEREGERKKGDSGKVHILERSKLMTQESYYHPVKTARIGGESGGQLSGGGITPFCGGCRVEREGERKKGV
uniref:Uncharacterized protein n=1 Tax=Opuntia streptacantha TaxID=393608 RepID=A0A7C8YHI7_OPUST